MGQLKALSDEWWRELENLLAWRRNFTVRGAASFKNTDRCCTIDIAPRGSILQPKDRFPILVAITSYNSTNGATFKQIDPPSGSNAAQLTPGGLTNEQLGPAFETTSATVVPAGPGTAGAHVWLWMRPDASGNMRPVFEYAQSQAVIAVRLTGTATAGGYSGDVVEIAADGTVTATGASVGDGTSPGAKEINGAKGQALDTATGTVVMVKRDSSGFYSFVNGVALYNGSTKVAEAHRISTDDSPIAFTDDGDNGVKLGLAAGADYTVLQSNGGHVVHDWVRMKA